jgi:hypothetical protein
MNGWLPYLGDVLSGVASSDSAEQREMWNHLLLDGAQEAWKAARQPVHDQLQAALGKADLIAPGVSLYEIDLRLGDVALAREAGSSSTAGHIPLQFRLGPDLIIAKSTTPSIFGSDFDPKLSIDFAVVIEFFLVVQPEEMTIGLEVGSTHITGKDFEGNPHLDSQNWVSDIAKFFMGTVIPWFGGPDCVALVEAAIGQYDFASVMNKALQPVNDKLGELAKQGMGSLIAMFPDATLPSGLSPKALSLGGSSTSTGAAPLMVLAQPVTGDGVVRGSIHWPLANGQPQLDPPFVGAFTLSATVDRGAATGEFAQATDVTHLASMEYAPTSSDHVLNYSLVGLPIDEPIEVECAAAASVQWSGDASTKIPSPEREGWNGRVTIHPAPEIAHKFRDVQARSAGEEVELNPQPIPPGHSVRLEEEFRKASPASEVELNPQPIPPGRETSVARAGTELRGSAASEFNRSTETPIAEESPIRVSEMQVQDPSGQGAVQGINFVVHFLDRPK